MVCRFFWPTTGPDLLARPKFLWNFAWNVLGGNDFGPSTHYFKFDPQAELRRWLGHFEATLAHLNTSACRSKFKKRQDSLKSLLLGPSNIHAKFPRNRPGQKLWSDIGSKSDILYLWIHLFDGIEESLRHLSELCVSNGHHRRRATRLSKQIAQWTSLIDND